MLKLHTPPRRIALPLVLVLTAASFAVAGCDSKSADKKGPAAKAPGSDKPAPTGKGVIKGTVKFEGAVPPPEPWGGASNAECKKLGGETIQLVKVQDKKLEDAFVYVKEGLPPGSYPTPEKQVSFDQKGCEFSPRVFGVV